MGRNWKFDWNKTKETAKKEIDQNKSYADDRFWKLDVDENKKGQALIRFLPDKKGNPFRQYFNHWFNYETVSGGSQLYVGNCATSIKMPCPICEKNRELWNSPYKEDEAVARTRKRKMHYIANILVLKDEKHPENEGKVFLYDFGPQIFGLYKKAMFGPEETDPEYDAGKEPDTFVPCDFDNGADFLLRSTLKPGTEKAKVKWNTYESSKFQKNSELFGDSDEDERNEKIDEVMEQTHDLDEWLNPDIYPSESEILEKLGHLLLKDGDSKDKYESPEKNEEDDTRMKLSSDDEEPEGYDDPEVVEGETSNVTSDEEFLNGILK